MDRAANDNALLADSDRVKDVGTIYKRFCIVAVCGVAIGIGWFLCVAVPAGAIWQ